MKLVNSQLELKAIKTLCSGKEKISGDLLAGLTVESFYYEPTKESFRQILKAVQSNGSIPDWDAVCSDPAISSKNRRILKAYDGSPIRNTEKAASVKKGLERFRQLRGLAAMGEKIYEIPESEKVDVDELLEELSDDLLKVRSRIDAKSQMFHTGKGNNSTQVIKELLYGKRKKVVPTGFKAFDDKNGGFLEGSLVVIAANSGGGKSALANQLGINFTTMALEDTCILPFEMTTPQMWARTSGVLTGLDVNSIQQQRLTDSEKHLIKKKYKQFAKTLKKNNTRHTIFSPEEDMTIEEVLFMLKPYNYKVIIVDYIGLLKGADGDDQVKELGRIARFAKVYAKNTGSIVILLAQLSDEGQVKYARAIKEHANNLWTWHMNDDEAEVSILDIKQQKARNQLRFNFQLQSHNSSMRITDVDEDHMDMLGTGSSDKDKRGKSSKKNKHHKQKDRRQKKEKDTYLDDLADESDED